MRWLMSNPFDVRFRAPSRGRWTRVGTVAAGCALLGACGFLRPSELRAGTDLLPTLGSHASGAVSFVQRADGVQVTYDLYGLAPGSLHALHLHEQGNCNARDASSAGPIFNPDAGRLKRGARPDGRWATCVQTATVMPAVSSWRRNWRWTASIRRSVVRCYCIATRIRTIRRRTVARAPHSRAAWCIAPERACHVDITVGALQSGRAWRSAETTGFPLQAKWPKWAFVRPDKVE